MSARWLWFLGPGLGLLACTDEPAAVTAVVFESRSLSRDYYSEGCASADVNGDGHTDMFTGPFWYEGPSFDMARELDVPKQYAYDAPDRRYFLNFAGDLDGDDLIDALVVGYPGTRRSFTGSNCYPTAVALRDTWSTTIAAWGFRSARGISTTTASPTSSPATSAASTCTFAVEGSLV